MDLLDQGGVSQNLSSVTNDSLCYKSTDILASDWFISRFITDFSHLSLKEGFVKRVLGTHIQLHINITVMLLKAV